MTKKLFAFLALLWCCSMPSFAAITLGANNHGDNGAVSNATVGCAMTQVAAGSLVTAEVSFSGQTSLTSVADNHNAGNYTAAVAVHKNTSIDQWLGIYYKENNSALQDLTVTLTTAAAKTFAAISCQEWKNAATSSSLDLAPAANDSSGTNVKIATSPTPAVSGEVVIAAAQMSAVTPTAGTNYTLIDSNTSTLLFFQYWIQTTATSTNGQFTSSSDTAWTGELASFKPPSTRRHRAWVIQN